jgi:hypothetical protein
LPCLIFNSSRFLSLSFLFFLRLNSLSTKWCQCFSPFLQACKSKKVNLFFLSFFCLPFMFYAYLCNNNPSLKWLGISSLRTKKERKGKKIDDKA